MSELYLPCLPEFEIGDVDFDFETNKVFFDLVSGCVSLTCFMSGILKVEEFEVSTDSNPQNSVDRDFKYLQVAGGYFEVDRSDIDIVSGQKLKLTERQEAQLNEYLKEEMVMV